MYQKTVLDSGLRVITYQMPQMQSQALGIWIGAGGRYERDEVAGISHFLEHLLFDGTTTRSGRKIKEAIEGIGGSLNGFTGEEITCYLVKVLGKYLDLGLDVLSDMVLNPKLDLKDVERERAIIAEEMKMFKDQPGHYVVELLTQLLWPEQPLGIPLTGTIESLARIKRKDLLEYKDRFYTGKNIVVASVGPVSHQAVVDGCEKSFSKLPLAVKPRFKPAVERQAKPEANFSFKETEQTHLALGVHGLSSTHPDRRVLGLLHVILGANMSSRLFQEVREKRGLAYEISSHVRKFKDTGIFFISAGVKNDKTVNAIEVILKELKKIKEGVKGQELRRAKEFYTGQLLMALEDTADHMLWLGEPMVTLDKVYTIQQVLKEIDRVTVDDIKRLARLLYRPEKLNLAVIGPVKDKDEGRLKELLQTL